MENVIMHMSTHPRLLKDVLTQYKSTFAALKELINNSIQANAKRIEINLVPTECDEDSINYHLIDSIQVIDDGDGIPFSQFHEKIMKVATDNKVGGLGIGRFGALQIGRTMSINTIGYESEAKKYTTTSIVWYLLFKTFNQSFGNLTQKNSTLATRIEESGIGVLEQLLWKHINNLVSQFRRSKYLIITKICYTRKHVGIIDAFEQTILHNPEPFCSE